MNRPSIIEFHFQTSQSISKECGQMNALIDDQQNKLMHEVFQAMQKSLNYSGKKTEDQLFKEFFGSIQTQTKNLPLAQRTNATNVCLQTESANEKALDTVSVKTQNTQQQNDLKILKNPKSLSNIHLRHIINSYLRGQCKKIERSESNYSCKEIQNSTRNLILNFFLRYTLIFEELQNMGSSETIQKQVKKSLVSIYIEIICLVFKKGFRRYLTLLKMIVRVWNIAGCIQNETFLHIKRQVKQILGIDVEFLLPQNDKLTYQLAFKLKGIPVKNFDYEKEKQRIKQQRLKKKKEKQKKRLQMKFKQTYQNNKNIRSQPKIKLENSNKDQHIVNQQIKNLQRKSSISKPEPKLQFKSLDIPYLNQNYGNKPKIKQYTKIRLLKQEEQQEKIQQKGFEINQTEGSRREFEDKYKSQSFSSKTFENNNIKLEHPINHGDTKFIETLRRKIKRQNESKTQNNHRGLVNPAKFSN